MDRCRRTAEGQAEAGAVAEAEAETDPRRPQVITLAFWLLITSYVLWVLWFIVVLGSRAPGFMDPESPFGWVYAVWDLWEVVLTGTGVALLYGREGNTFFRRRP